MACLLNHTNRLLDLNEMVPCFFQQQLPGFGQPHATSHPLEESNAEFLL